MIKQKTEFFVGLFVILGIASILILILQVSNIQTMYTNKNVYILNAAFKNVGTLKKKAKVTIGGVKIGTVNKIELKQNESNEYYPQIEMSIYHDICNIPIDSSVNILMSSLLGDSYIQIELGNENEFLQDGDMITLTTQALIIEELISKFAFDK